MLLQWYWTAIPLQLKCFGKAIRMLLECFWIDHRMQVKRCSVVSCYWNSIGIILKCYGTAIELLLDCYWTTIRMLLGCNECFLDVIRMLPEN